MATLPSITEKNAGDVILSDEHDQIVFALRNGTVSIKPNTVVLASTTDPGTPEIGEVWYNTTDNVVRYYDGTSNVDLTVASLTPNVQTGTTYTVVDGDRAKLITMSNAANIAVTLPDAAGAGFDNGWFTSFQNTGVGKITITPTTSTIDGAASLDLSTDQGVTICSDGTNYYTERGVGGGSGSGSFSRYFSYMGG